MTFELRQLKSTDIFLMIKILNKIGFSKLKNKLTPAALSDLVKHTKDGTDVDDATETEIGAAVIMEVADMVLTYLPDAETDIMEFMGSVADLTLQEVKDLSMVDFMELLVQIIKKDDFRDFFGAASKLFK